MATVASFLATLPKFYEASTSKKGCSLKRPFKAAGILGRVDKRDFHRALIVIQAGICNGEQL
ncbi:hypothetical protein, partial [Primorskyibacter sp. 2E233]|uniref:hypothetical protein n=1 Tax=Primorskyibacter sp. 2E233 TaxID=3413431 RepID=UPI003BF4315C